MSVFGLSSLIWLPFLAGVWLVSRRGRFAAGSKTALILSAWSLLRVILFALKFRPERGLQAVERYDWLRSVGLEYHLAIDGVSLVFLLLTCVVLIMSVLACRQLPEADDCFHGLVLLLFSGLLGTFSSQNFLHFFFHWELSLIPAFFLVKFYGGADRSFAAFQFFLYTMVGSIAMLLSLLALGIHAGSFELAQLGAFYAREGAGAAISFAGMNPKTIGLVLFFLAFAGVAVKVPLWPFHGWLPSLYAEAPTPITMILTGIMSKMGVYALVRLILPIFPRELQALHRPLLTLAVVTILYGAWAAFAQRDIKRLFAYSSLSHLGYCFLGVFAAAQPGSAAFDNERAAALAGVLLQVLSHGLVAATLFAFVAFLEARSGGFRLIERFGGLRKVAPVFAGFMGIALFASLGLPGLSGFPAEFLIFKGSFVFAPIASAVAIFGLLLTAVYLLTFFGEVFLGPLKEHHAAMAELTLREKAVVIPSIFLVLILGIAPELAITLFNPAVTDLVQRLH